MKIVYGIIGLAVGTLLSISIGIFISEPLSPGHFTISKFSTDDFELRKENLEPVKNALLIIREKIADYEKIEMFDKKRLQQLISVVDRLTELDDTKLKIEIDRALQICPTNDHIKEYQDPHFAKLKANLQNSIPSWTPDMNLVRKGRKVYQKYCAVCHGVNGDGESSMPQDMNTPPRDFTGKTHKTKRATFKFKSNSYGSLPTDEDLTRTVKQGIPGTNMPSFNHLPQNDIKSVIEFIKTFDYITWKYSRIEPSILVSTPPPEIFSQKWIDAGRLLYKRSCIECHGDLENGQEPHAKKELDWMRDGKSILVTPRNFTIEKLKRGRSLKDIYTTLHVGIGGTSMPSYSSFTEEELWKLVAYVRYLLEKF